MPIKEALTPTPRAELSEQQETVVFATDILRQRPNTKRILISAIQGTDLLDSTQPKASRETATKISYAGLGKKSLTARTEYWNNRSEKGFAEQNEEWNQAVCTWIQKKLSNEKEAPQTQAVLSWIKLDTKNTAEILGRPPESISDTVEGFRKRYFTEGSQIEDFIADMAEGSKQGKTDGPVNLRALEVGLTIVHELLTCFGEKKEYIPDLVIDYALTHGLLFQPKYVQEALSQELLTSSTE